MPKKTYYLSAGVIIFGLVVIALLHQGGAFSGGQAILLVLLFVTAWIWGGYFWKRKRCTVPGQATVTAVTKDPQKTSNFVITVQYVVENMTYTGEYVVAAEQWERMGVEMGSATTVPILYNPRNPNDMLLSRL